MRKISYIFLFLALISVDFAKAIPCHVPATGCCALSGGQSGNNSGCYSDTGCTTPLPVICADKDPACGGTVGCCLCYFDGNCYTTGDGASPCGAAPDIPIAMYPLLIGIVFLFFKYFAKRRSFA